MRSWTWVLVGLFALGPSFGEAQVRSEGPRGRVVPEPEAIEQEGPGELDLALVARLLNERRPALVRCYERALRTEPTLEGRIVIVLSIDASGRLSSARVRESTTGDDSLSRCWERAFRGARVRRGPDGGSVAFVIPLRVEPAP